MTRTRDGDTWAKVPSEEEIEASLWENPVVIGAGGARDTPEIWRKGYIMNGMHDFGWAIHALRAGRHVARAGWNGRGMWLALMPGHPDGVPANAHAASAMGVAIGETVRVRPYIAMRDIQGNLVPWLASQTDMLAEDWEVVG